MRDLKVMFSCLKVLIPICVGILAIPYIVSVLGVFNSFIIGQFEANYLRPGGDIAGPLMGFLMSCLVSIGSLVVTILMVLRWKSPSKLKLRKESLTCFEYFIRRSEPWCWFLIFFILSVYMATLAGFLFLAYQGSYYLVFAYFLFVEILVICVICANVKYEDMAIKRMKNEYNGM